MNDLVKQARIDVMQYAIDNGLYNKWALRTPVRYSLKSKTHLKALKYTKAAPNFQEAQVLIDTFGIDMDCPVFVCRGTPEVHHQTGACYIGFYSDVGIFLFALSISNSVPTLESIHLFSFNLQFLKSYDAAHRLPHAQNPIQSIDKMMEAIKINSNEVMEYANNLRIAFSPA